MDVGFPAAGTVREWERPEGSRPHVPYDIEVVETAGMADLNPQTLQGIARKARELFPNHFGRLTDESVLEQLEAVRQVGGVLRPTVSGLMAAGIFPQRFFPRLHVVLKVSPEKGGRCTDSLEVIGSVPDMLRGSLTWVGRHAKDWPADAVREALANALQHRDYSPEGRGSPVLVNLYADRLEITNPGSLFGAVAVESLGREGLSASRNAFLSRLLSYTPYDDGVVTENKGTGFLIIQDALVEAQMPEPRICNARTFFRLTLEKRRSAPQERNGSFGGRPDEVILAELRRCGSLSVKELIALSGFSRATVSNHVRTLVERGWLEPTEAARNPKQRYRLSCRKCSEDRASDTNAAPQEDSKNA